MSVAYPEKPFGVGILGGFVLNLVLFSYDLDFLAIKAFILRGFEPVKPLKYAYVLCTLQIIKCRPIICLLLNFLDVGHMTLTLVYKRNFLKGV